MNVDKYRAEPHWHNVTHYEQEDKNWTQVALIADSSENQSWGLATFFEIAIPLVVCTILLPLIVGSLVRALLQTLTRGRTWWRLGFACAVIVSVLQIFVTPLASSNANHKIKILVCFFKDYGANVCSLLGICLVQRFSMGFQ